MSSAFIRISIKKRIAVNDGRKGKEEATTEAEDGHAKVGVNTAEDELEELHLVITKGKEAAEEATTEAIIV